MNEIKTLVEVSNITSTNEKLKLLKENESEKLKDLLIAAYDGFKVYGIKHITIDKYNGNKVYKPELHSKFISMLEMLTKVNANDKIRQEVKDFLNSCPEPQRTIYYKILIKDLTIGLGVKSVNKVFPKLIREFKLAKANPYEGQDLNTYKIVQSKYDGYRCLIMSCNGKVTAFTSSGKEIPLKNIEKEVSKIDGDFILDGELISTSRTKTSTICNRLIKGNKSITDEQLEYYAFDIIRYGEYVTGEFKQSCKDRLLLLSAVFLTYRFKQLKLANSYNSYSIEEVLNLYKLHRKNGEEGIIVKDPYAPYTVGRSNNWLKLKAINSATLKVIDIIPHSKEEGLMGALVCEDFSGNLTVKVGSGFTDEDRQTLNSENIVGKCIEIIYNEVQYTKDNKPFLFLPRFKEVRDDKQSPDSIDKIIKECM